MPIAATSPSPNGAQTDGRVQPLDARQLARIAAALRAYRPLDLDTILDDLDVVAGEHAADTVLPEPAARLRVTLRHLVAIAVSEPCRDVPATLAAAAGAAQALLRDHHGNGPQRCGSVSRQRRTALLVLDLLDQMIETQIIKGKQ